MSNTDNQFAQIPPKMTILSDHPACMTESGIDLLSMEPRLGAVFDILRHKQTQCPTTIAIYGDWGTGKTSAMRWLESQLRYWNKVAADQGKNKERHPLVYPIWFDPWRYQTREEVWRGIISEVILSLFDVKNLNRENMATRMQEAAKKFGAFLGRGFLHALSHMKLKSSPAGLEVSGEVFQSIFEEYQKTAHPERAHLNQFETTLKNWVEEMLPADQSERIAIFIDDLDRCLPEVALEVLEAVKLYLNIKPLIFIVGVDRAVVDAVVADHYAKRGLDKEKSRSYLNKIFQVEMSIAPSEAQLSNFLEAQVQQLNLATGGYWDKMLMEAGYKFILESAIGRLARHNPREIKRLLNSSLLMGRAAVDNPGLVRIDSTSPDLRFIQGVQVFLLRKILTFRLVHPGTLLIDRSSVEWFWKASCLISEQGATPEQIRDFLSEDDRIPPSSDSWEKSLEDLYLDLPITEDGPLDISLLQDPDFWTLLSIPFSQEVCQHAPLPIEPDGKAVPSAKEENLQGLPTFLRQRIALSLDKPVKNLQETDLAIVEDLDLSRANLQEVNSKDLARFPQLRKLSLRENPGLRNSGHEVLSVLPDLRSLDLSGTRIGDKALVGLEHLTSLEELFLGGAQITDEGIARLGPLRKLKALKLNGTHITNAGLAHLSSLSNIEILSLSNTAISEEGLINLIGLQSLTTLNLNNTEIGNQSLDYLSNMPSITSLYIARTNVTDTGISYLSKMVRLEELNLTHLEITDSALAFISKCRTLKKLDLSETLISDNGIKDLVNLTSLKSLTLRKTRISNLSTSSLKLIDGLEELVIADCKISDRAMLQLARMMHLRILDLTSTRISDGGLTHLIAAPQLRSLNLTNTKVTNACLPSIMAMKTLEKLSIRNTGVTKDGFEELKRKLPKLSIHSD